MIDLNHSPIQPLEISTPMAPKYLITVASLVTNQTQYRGMLESAYNAGFDREDVQFVYIDNSESNQFDGFSGLNHFMNTCDCRYLIVCHQDVEFVFDRFEDLINRIKEVEAFDSNWGVLGNAGKRNNSRACIRITDPGANDLRFGTFPSEVITLDENFLVINMKNRLAMTSNLQGFHLYATDLCFNARQLGFKSYVVDFHLRHLSAGNPDKSYFELQNQLVENYSQRKKAEAIYPMCSKFFVSSSKSINNFMKHKVNLNLYTSLLKRLNR